MLAAQFGWLPGLLWLVFGVCLAGAVQDFVILTASVRRGGRSLAQIARDELGGASGAITMTAILFVVVVALAVLGFVVVKALAESPWGTFTIAASIPIALLMGVWLYRIRPGRVGEASAAGVLLLFGAVVAGAWLSPGGAWASLAPAFTLSERALTTSIAVYGLVASVLPVWLLLCPRDYLSSYMKVGTIVLVVGTVLVVRPVVRAPALSPFVSGGGPIVGGPLFPFVFITIACGAISGFHALVASGTTPKMLDSEAHARAIGYGAMLMESLVGVTALVAASSLVPADYYAINLKPEAFRALAARLPLEGGRLGELTALLGEPHLAGRTGGGVSLAVGIAQIAGGIPGLAPLLAYLYHFVIMFEALFILTTIDTGTRIARFLVQEVAGRIHPRLGRTDWMPGTIVSSVLVVAAWSWFVYTGSIQRLWPMFGVANQLLAVVALTVATTVLVNEGKSRYAWVTLAPLALVATTTLSGAVLSTRGIFWPAWRTGATPTERVNGLLDVALTVVMAGCAVAVLADAIPRWARHWRRGRPETIEALAKVA